MGQGVIDLVTKHRGQAVLSFGHRQNAGVHHHLATRKAEGVDLPAADDPILPLEALRLQLQSSQHIFIVRGICESPADAPNRVNNRPLAHHVGFLKHLLERLRTELGLLLRTERNDLMPAERSCLPALDDDDARNEESEKNGQQSDMDVARWLPRRHAHNHSSYKPFAFLRRERSARAAGETLYCWATP